MKIDIFNHVMPQAYLELVKQHSKEPGIVKRMTNLRMLWDIEQRVEMLRKQFPDVKQVLTLGLPAPELLGGPDRVARVRARRERRHGRDVPALARRVSGVRRLAADEQRAGGAGGDGPRDRQARREGHPDHLERRRPPARRPGVLPGVRARHQPSRPADLDASGAAGQPRRLRRRAEIEVRDLAGARLAVRDQRRHGAHRVLGPAAAPAEDAHHHAPLRRHDPLLRRPRGDAVGAARLPIAPTRTNPRC